MTKVRVRFAPSPTGPLHIGGLRTALYNYLFARKHNGDFLLRIEDTDQQRYIPAAEQYIKRALEWSGLIPDEGPDQKGQVGPYRQSARKEIYHNHVISLLKSGYAYYAFDTPEELDLMRKQETKMGNDRPKYDQRIRLQMKNGLTLKATHVRQMIDQGVPYTVRMKVPEGEKVSFQDEVRGNVIFETSELDDKVILKADGLPTYHLANVVDDHLMGISHVIRGEEWLSSTAHHVLLYQGFEWTDTMPVFAHLPLILKPSGNGKLSKRDGQKFGFPVFPLEWKPDHEDAYPGFRSCGFHAPALINFLALLGWNPGTEQEIFSMGELVEAFRLDHVGKSGARFDYDRALWFNARYLHEMDGMTLYKEAKSYFDQTGYQGDDAYMHNICLLLRERVQTLDQLPVAAAFFFEEVELFDEKTIRKKWKEGIYQHYRAVVQHIGAVLPFEAVPIKEAVTQYLETNDLKFGDLLPLLRIGVSGTSSGPDLFQIFEILGQGMVSDRLAAAPGQFDQIILEAGNPR